MSEAAAAAPGVESWEAVYEFRQMLDDLLESSQAQDRNLVDVLEEMLAVVRVYLGADSAALKLIADSQDIFALDQVLRDGDPDLQAQDIEGWGEDGDVRHYTTQLDVGAEVLGTVTLGFEGPNKQTDEWLARGVDAFVEQIDNLVYEVRSRARSHRLAVHVQLCLETTVFEEGLDSAMEILLANLPIHRALFLYRNDHILYPELVAHRLYTSADGMIGDSLRAPSPEAAAALKGKRMDEVDPNDFPLEWGPEGLPPRQMPLIHAGRSEQTLGRIFFWLQPDANVRAARAQLEILRSCVVQRLADYSKETRNLEKYFSPETVYRLLREENYEDMYLLPRVETCGLIFVDVAGFTRLSETALADPRDCGRFIDAWSEGAARILMEHGGVMDKLIGDCVMGIFGPPFFDRPPAQLAADVTKAALEIRTFTQELIEDPRLEDLRPELEKAGGLDVSTGVHIAPVNVGLFGPNQDYTAFGSGVNNTARIQSAAAPGETLALVELVAALEPFPALCDGFQFGEQGEYIAKNVAEPLRYKVVKNA